MIAHYDHSSQLSAEVKPLTNRYFRFRAHGTFDHINKKIRIPEKKSPRESAGLGSVG
jgi:hypothetical protein